MLVKQDRYTKKWEFALFWIVANTVGVVVGLWFGALLNDNLWPSIDVPPNIYLLRMIDHIFQRLLIIGLSIGCFAGIAGWLVLRRLSLSSNWWIVASMGGWALGLTIPLIVRDQGLSAILGGIILGFAQWVILRQYLSRAYWWIIAWGVSGLVAMSLIPANLSMFELFHFPLKYFLVGFIPSVITGLTLIWLLKVSETTEVTSNVGRA